MISDTATEAESNFLGLTVGLVINDEVGPQPKHWENLWSQSSHTTEEKKEKTPKKDSFCKLDKLE